MERVKTRWIGRGMMVEKKENQKRKKNLLSRRLDCIVTCPRSSPL
jgi:hypothetical protein